MLRCGLASRASQIRPLPPSISTATSTEFQMDQSNNARLLVIAIACAALVGCSSVQPVAYSGIDSSTYLQPNSKSDAARVPYRYATLADWRRYRKLIIDPVTVYRGPDNQFGTMHDADKTALASYMQSTFAEKMGKHFELANAAGPGTLRLKLQSRARRPARRSSRPFHDSISRAASITVSRPSAAATARSPARSPMRSRSTILPPTAFCMPT